MLSSLRKFNPSTALGVISLIFLASLFRFYLISDLPAGLSELELLNSDHFYIRGLVQVSNWFKLNDPANLLLFIRSVQGALSLLTAVFIYLAARKFFGSRMGLLAGFLWAVLYPANVFSRAIGPEVYAGFFMAAGFLSLAYFKKLAGKIFLAISAIGLASIAPQGYVYLPVLALLYFLLPRIKVKRPVMSAFFPSTLALNTNFFQGLAGLFFTPGDPSPFHNTPGIPALDPLMLALTAVGMIYLVSKYSSKVRYYLILFLIPGAAAGAVRVGTDMASFNLLYLPLVVLLAVTFDFGMTYWFRLFPLNKLVKGAGMVVAVLLLFVAMLYSYNRLFIAFYQSPEVRAAYNEGIVAVAKAAIIQDKKTVAYVPDNKARLINDTLEFLSKTKIDMTERPGDPKDLFEFFVVIDPDYPEASKIIAEIEKREFSKTAVTDQYGQTLYILYS